MLLQLSKRTQQVPGEGIGITNTWDISVVGAPAVMKGSCQLQLLPSTGELAFPKSTYVFKPFIFCGTESLNISASVLLFLLCVGAEGIYLMSQSGNAGAEEVLDCLTRQAEPGMLLPVTSF